MNIEVLVEGHGDVAAIPVLIRRISSRHAPDRIVNVGRPFRLPRSKFVKEAEVKRVIELLGRKTNPGDGILVVFDADDDCPAQLGARVLGWAEEARSDRRVGVVLAKREFEAWYLAAASSLAGRLGFPSSLAPPNDPESIRDAKGWLRTRRHLGYSETVDQGRLAEAIDIDDASSSPSFAKLRREILRLVSGDVVYGR